ncbi:MAG: fibronectin type III domain-containing protein [Gemmatimonadetes bacterium]|nr:fibronectin type III domain-containing protein [Gemmatimonadota bacterium]
MATFPKREPEIIRLAHDISTGLAANPELFPAPPAAPDQGLVLIDAYYQARDASIAKAAESRDANGAKDKAVQAIVDWSKSEINYAVSLFRKNGPKLRLIGWGPRRTPAILPETLPGQVGNLLVQHEGKNAVSLSWRDPLDGGEVAAYRIQRRKPGGDWYDVGTAVSSEVTLYNQDPGVEFEYQVISVNKTGDGAPSNIVRAVL